MIRLELVNLLDQVRKKAVRFDVMSRSQPKADHRGVTVTKGRKEDGLASPS